MSRRRDSHVTVMILTAVQVPRKKTPASTPPCKLIQAAKRTGRTQSEIPVAAVACSSKSSSTRNNK